MIKGSSRCRSPQFCFPSFRLRLLYFIDSRTRARLFYFFFFSVNSGPLTSVFSCFFSMTITSPFPSSMSSWCRNQLSSIFPIWHTLLHNPIFLPTPWSKPESLPRTPVCSSRSEAFPTEVSRFAVGQSIPLRFPQMIRFFFRSIP